MINDKNKKLVHQQIKNADTNRKYQLFADAVSVFNKLSHIGCKRKLNDYQQQQLDIAIEIICCCEKTKLNRKQYNRNRRMQLRTLFDQHQIFVL